MTRAEVAAEARSWLGTPYAHRQRLKGAGVDCAQLPLAVYAACGLIAPAEVPPYAAQWHLHRGEELYVAEIVRLGGRETELSAAGVGDLLLWRYGRTFSHGAIRLERGRLVHAVRGQGVVLGDLADADLAGRPMKAFTLFPSPPAGEEGARRAAMGG